jgi:hypothetical protein
MSLELSGTTGVKGVAGSVAAPSIVGDDTNTGISFPAADTIKFSTGGVERMQITNSGVSGTGLSAGKILQVVQGTRTSEFSSTSTSYTDLTGLNVAITPSTNSKILAMVIIQAYLQSDNDEGFGIKLIKTPSGGSASTVFTSGSKTDVRGYTNFTGEHIQMFVRSPWHILDSSVGGNGSTSITYKVQVANETSSSIIYSQGGNISSITLFEIGA